MKLFRGVVGASLLALLVLPTVSLAQTMSVAQMQAEIQSLLTTVQSLQQQLAVIQSKSSPEPATVRSWCHSFTGNLGVGSAGSEVEALQTALAKDGEVIS